MEHILGSVIFLFGYKRGLVRIKNSFYLMLHADLSQIYIHMYKHVPIQSEQADA